MFFYQITINASVSKPDIV